MTEPLATVRSYPDLVAAFRARKAQLALSDDALDHRAGLVRGHTGKILGRSPVRGIGSTVIGPLMDALGVAFVMVEDPAKLAQGGPIEKRDERHVRRNHPAISKEAAVKLARSIVLSDAGRKAARARWRRTTPAERQALIARLNTARAAKMARRARTKRAA